MWSRIHFLFELATVLSFRAIQVYLLKSKSYGEEKALLHSRGNGVWAVVDNGSGVVLPQQDDRYEKA